MTAQALKSSGTYPVVVVGAAPAGRIRRIEFASIHNADASAVDLTVSVADASGTYRLWDASLPAGETLELGPLELPAGAWLQVALGATPTNEAEIVAAWEDR